MNTVSILLIDDDPGERALARRALAAEFGRPEVTEAEGREGFEAALARGGFDLVVTDYELGWATGVQVALMVKAAFPDLPVIMFTGSGNEEVAVEAMKAGLDDYVVKSSRRLARLGASAGAQVRLARERRRRGDALGLAERNLAEAVEGMPAGFVLLDAERRFVMCNGLFRRLYPAAAPLMTPGAPYEAILRRIEEAGDATAAEGRQEGAPAVPPRRELWEREELLASGRWILATDRRTPDGWTVGVRTDVTEAKRQEANLRAARDEAQAASRAKSAFLASMSHELRTPLNAIIGFSETMAREVMGPLGSRRYLDYAEDILRSGRHLLALVNDLLDVARIEASKVELHEEVVAVGDLVEEAVRIAGAAAGRRAEIRFEAPAELRLRADRRAAAQVLLNLLSNALKFSSPEGAVRVVVRCGADLAIAVEDEGAGIPEETLARLGQPFVQASNVLTRRHRGTGMGLFISRSLVELHGGRLDIDSAVGRGTTATVRFPATRVVEAEAPVA
jgi:signal transduction histidine kinase